MNEFRTCPACGYGHGFHVAFRDDGDGPRVLLICPSCGHSYDPGWAVRPANDPPHPGPAFSQREDTAG